MKAFWCLAAGLLCAALLIFPVHAEDGSGPEGELPNGEPARELKAVWLVPGQDFLLPEDPAEAQAGLNAALDQIEAYGMNAVFYPINNETGVLFSFQQFPAAVGYDLAGWIEAGAAERGLSAYAVLDASFLPDGQGGYGPRTLLTAGGVQQACALAREFLAAHKPDALLLDGYCNQKTAESMAAYRAEGASMGFENWVRECTTSLVVNVQQAAAQAAPNTRFGLVAGPVWANAASFAGGSDTGAEYQMRSDGFVDLPAILILARPQLLAVRCPGSTTDEQLNFSKLLSWWAQQGSEAGCRVYALLANDRLGGDEPGWKAPDQVMRQVIVSRDTEGCGGVVYGSYQALTEDRGGSTGVLLQYYSNQVDEQDILTDLTVSTPEQRTFTTREPTVHFYGASDPNFSLQLNGQTLTRTENGVFSADYELSPGLNTFSFTHKEKTITYNITREVVIIQEVAPAGAITVEGGTQVHITVKAYAGASVQASVGGTAVPLAEQQQTDDGADGTSGYVPYTGVYTAPAAGESEQEVGTVQVSASWQGVTQTAAGGLIRVAAAPRQAPQVEGQKGSMVEVTAAQARTYPGGVLSNDPWGNCFPLPAGTVDYLVSDKLTYTADGTTGEYYLLGSGLRVSAADVTSLGEVEWEWSRLTGASSSADGDFLYIRLDRTRKTAYTVEFSPMSFSGVTGVQSFGASQMTIALKDTQLEAGGLELAGNTLFAGASLSQQGNDAVLTLSLRKAGAFLGYRAYYEGDTLVFRFRQIPAVSGGNLAGLKVYLDPGHGGYDGGTSIEGMYTEKTMNANLAARTAEILRGRGAEVQVTDTSGYVSLGSRVSQSQGFCPHLFVSIHHNSSGASVTGTEAYFFNPYSELLADQLAARVSSALSTRDRGEKYGIYRVTTHMEFPACLVECGFLTNTDELSKLCDGGYQDAMAHAIADAIEAAILSMQ